MRSRSPAALAALVLALFGAIWCAESDAAGGPDLAVVSVGAKPVKVPPTGSVSIARTVANVGRSRSRRSDVHYVLSRRTRARASDPELGVLDAIPALSAGKRRSSRSVLGVVPPNVAAGRYRLIACIRPRAPAKERQTRNDCHLAKGRITVVAGARPAAVRSQRADDRAASAVLGPEGGTLDATAPDGSVLRLTLPAGALTGRLLVRLVPLTRLDGLSLSGGSFVAGAELEPAGLLLNLPGQLEVVGKKPALAASYDPGGAGLHLVPFRSKPSFAALVDRFVGFAMFSAARPSTTAAKVPLPADAAYRIQQAIARLEVRTSRGLPAVATPAEDTTVAEVRLEAAAYYIDVLRPSLIDLSRATSLDPDAAVSELLRLTLAIRELELLGLDEPLPDAYALEASNLMQDIVRKVFAERIRRCQAGEVRSAVGMIGFLYRSGSAGAPVGVPPHVKTVDDVLGQDWQQRAATCLKLKFRVSTDTQNEWRLGLPQDTRLSVLDVGWHDATANIEAALAGWSGSLGGPVTSLISQWQQGLLLRWLGQDRMTVDGIHALPRPHPAPPPNTCEDPTDASAYRYNDPQGGFTTELVPIIETFDDRLGQLDKTGKLQVRFAELGTLERIYHCSFNGNELDQGPTPVFENVSRQRGDQGLFHQDRNNPLTIGAERWYVLPLQGGTVDLTEGGPIKLGGVNYNGSTWSVAGTLTVTIVPPS